MKKIISLFKRDYEGTRLVYDEVVPSAEWVIEGEGVATHKRDGTACMVRGGKLYKRYDVKKKRTPPEGFEPAQDPDPVTGHWPGWVPVGDGPEDKWHREALVNRALFGDTPDGTYELCGLKVQGNAEGLVDHTLIPHGGSLQGREVPRDFTGIRDYLTDVPIEGIVWHHPDGRMVKIKRKDFGLPWPVQRGEVQEC